MKVWITKYALTSGVFVEEAEVSKYSNNNVSVLSKYGNFMDHYHGENSEWCRTREAAIERVKAMKKKKIASLKNQIAKLEALDPNEVPE